MSEIQQVAMLKLIVATNCSYTASCGGVSELEKLNMQGNFQTLM